MTSDFHFYRIRRPDEGRRATLAALKRRERRERLRREELEWVVGGPLVDIAEPVVGGSTSDEHAILLRVELEERAIVASHEARLIGFHFARGCCVRQAAFVAMIDELLELSICGGGPRLAPTYSTSPRTRTLSGVTIPRLPTNERQTP